ncbi:hypothetical protein SAMN05216403_10538 [Nitrosospira multiformis ATCC 25196]|uniref:Uncharacterized protein n=1 Tax=Nitrosospira multiformis (strain ATCC 25196 / NCIMB 11849 / C 71) TaxID=323848 RepID=A0A1H5TRZ3_NITMU|nr:hypothetical protein SAMN05216403_10538 [Nitrosospira multiformis ATCC 25196]
MQAAGTRCAERIYFHEFVLQDLHEHTSQEWAERIRAPSLRATVEAGQGNRMSSKGERRGMKETMVIRHLRENSAREKQDGKAEVRAERPRTGPSACSRLRWFRARRFCFFCLHDP